MSKDVSPQVDIGSLSISGLTAFAPILTALTADDVSPMAMVQLEQLGAVFHINGKYAAQVPDLLQRCASKRADRLGLLIGWRKGDSASYMMQSAGGQALAMLCFCLKNLYRDDVGGSILYDLSEKVLPSGLAVSSIGQLSKVMNILGTKLLALGFGNIFAQQVVRIQDAYAQLSKNLPKSFFDSMTREPTVDLLMHLSRVFSEEDCLIRISGSSYMGSIMAIVLIMFPGDVTLTVEGYVLHQGPRKSIIVEIDASKSTTISFETKLNHSETKPLNITFAHDFNFDGRFRCHFTWQNHIADSLCIGFADFGLQCSQELLIACCDMILAMIQATHNPVTGNNFPQRRNTFWSLLGMEPLQRIYTGCRTVFGVVPSNSNMDVQQAYSNLAAAFNAIMKQHNISCSCSASDRCESLIGWGENPRRGFSFQTCVIRTLWRIIGSTLSRGTISTLVNADSNATIKYEGRTTVDEKSFAPRIDPATQELSSGIEINDAFEELHAKVIEICSGQNFLKTPYVLACSNGSSTIYPTSLPTLRSAIDEPYKYDLRDGRLIIKGHYYDELQASHVPERLRAVMSLHGNDKRISPSSLGEHSDLMFTIKETSHGLELFTSINARGQVVKLDLSNILRASMGCEIADACDHPRNTPADPTVLGDVLTTSVASPRAQSNDTIAIVQTKGNKIAQLLACFAAEKALLQRNCCLNCAVGQAKIRGLKQVIVAF